VKVRYALDAVAHIAAIHAYIAVRNRDAATRVIGRIRTAAERLGDHPKIGRAGALAGTLEWVVSGLPYIIVYELDPQNAEVVVLGVYHGAQLRPGQTPAPDPD